MITNRIKALFNFIEFLNSNTENFKQYDEVINELYLLDKQRNNFNAKANFTEKLKYDEVQTEIKDKFNIIKENIIIPIKSKATELNVCNFENEPLYNWYRVETEIYNLKENFKKEDVAVINNYKNKYLEYRTKTKGEAFFSLDFFFSDLDRILKTLFDFFKESKENEFEAFETKIIQVNDISEAITLFNKGHKKIIIPTPNNDSKQRLSKSLSDINFFQIYFETNNGKEYNNLSIINPENWDNLRDNFFTQRMEKYKESYTQTEKINLEIEYLENLTINKTDYKILKDRYKEYLKSKQTPPQQPETKKPKKPKKSLFEFIHNIEDKEAFLQDLKNTFPTEIGKSIKAIIVLLKKDKCLIHNDREFSDVVNAIKIFFNRDIGSIQSIRDAKNTDDKIFIEPIELKLNPLIIKHKTT